MPFMQQMENGGLDVNMADPKWMWMSMFNQNQQNPQMAQFAMNMMVTKMLAQQQNQTKNQAPNNNNSSNSNNNNAQVVAMMDNLWTQFQKVLDTQPKQQYNPMDMMMMNKYMSQMNQQGGNSETSLVLAKMNEIMANNRTNELGMIMNNMQQFQSNQTKILAEALYSINSNKKDPKKDFLDTFKVVKDIIGSGNAQPKRKEDYDYALEDKRINLKKWELIEDKKALQSAAQRDHEKSMAYVQLGTQVLGGGIGDLIGGVAEGIATAKGGKKKITTPTSISNDDLKYL